MKLEFSGKNLTVTDAIKDKIEKKLQKLEKFTGKMVSARITMEVQKNKNVAELVIHCSHDKIYKGKGTAGDMYMAINEAADGIEHQAKKVKGKILAGRTKPRKSGMADEGEAAVVLKPKPEAPRYQRKNEYYVERPMSVEDALTFLDEKDLPLVVFWETKSDSICVVYKKGKGSYILVETENG